MTMMVTLIAEVGCLINGHCARHSPCLIFSVLSQPRGGSFPSQSRAGPSKVRQLARDLTGQPGNGAAPPSVWPQRTLLSPVSCW